MDRRDAFALASVVTAVLAIVIVWLAFWYCLRPGLQDAHAWAAMPFFLTFLALLVASGACMTIAADG